MTTLTRFSALAAATLLTVTVLSGCAPTGGFDLEAIGKTTKPSVSATPTAAALTAATITVGQELTPAETLELRRNYIDLITAGKVIYTTSSGVNIVVARTQPLPAVVVADAAAKAVAAAKVSAAAGDPANGGVMKQLNALRTDTFKSLVLVVSVFAGDSALGAPAGRYIWRWIAAVPGIGAHYFSSQAAAIAWANSYVAAKPDPTLWAVIG